jgi:hypothetical protein
MIGFSQASGYEDGEVKGTPVLLGEKHHFIEAGMKPSARGTSSERAKKFAKE